MFHPETLTDRYQPRAQDAAHDEFYARLAICQKCPLRSGHMCEPARQLATVLARPLNGFCQVGKWGTRPAPRAIRRPDSTAVESESSIGPVFASDPLDDSYPRIHPQHCERNLICHMYPRTAGQKWRRTVAHLAKRRSLFMGRRVIAIATDHECDPAKDVIDAFLEAGFDGDFLEFPNDPEIGEVATLVPMLEKISDRSFPGSLTFYCHSKGSTWPQSGSISHEWADVMFAANLDYPDLIAEALSTAVFAGAFRSFRQLHASNYHFSGTFFWFRNDVVFNQGTPDAPRWRCVEQLYGGVESWPALQVPRERSACLFLDDAAKVSRPDQDLYDVPYWEEFIRPAWRAFRKAHRASPGDGAPVCDHKQREREALYKIACETPWTINEHLPLLRELASQCEDVTEFGVERGCSTLAFLAGQPRRLASYDANPCPAVDRFRPLAGRTAFTFHQADSRAADIAPTDLLLIDTFHTAAQLAAELARHAAHVRKWIVLHDTETFGQVGEDGGEGLVPALDRFLQEHPEWTVKEVRRNNNGLTLLERVTDRHP